MTISNLALAGSKVLVTGATGFIGAHCIKELVERGYEVKAAVRSDKKFTVLKSCFDDKYNDKISSVLVSDIGDYDQLVEAVKDCDAILHLASPFSYTVTNFEEELLKPALEGTTTILKAAMKEPKMKRVVITSSFAAVFDSSLGLQPGVELCEKDFSPLTWEDGANTTDVSLAYRASKIIAEKAAWDFVADENPSFDITVLCPSMVLGPLVSTKLLESIESLNLSNSVVWKVATSNEIPPTKAPLFVDVRDLAQAHVVALTVKEASNSRYILSAGDYDNQEISDILRTKLQNESFRSKVPVGEPGSRLTGTHFTANNKKSIEELKIEYRPLKDSVLDLCTQLIEFSS